MTHVAKIIEIIGSSDKSWEDAAQVAVDEAKKTLHGLHGIEVKNMTAVMTIVLERSLNFGLV